MNTIQSILAVDDEVDMLSLLERIIKLKSAYTIRMTNNPLEVPALLEEGEYDLIISDLKMPGMSGLDLLRYVKERDRFEEVILLTAFGTVDSAREALALGALDYITKPFKKEQLMFSVERAMHWQRLHRELRNMAALYNIEPYARAREAFLGEYIRRLAERHQGDRETMSRVSGLPTKEIAEHLRERVGG